MQSAKVILSILICVTLLTACGLKGPLYLPADEPPANQSVSNDDEDAGQEEEKKENKKDKPQITATNQL